MIINPDNPTGMVYTEETLREIVAVAREHDLFIIADEVYTNIVYQRRNDRSDQRCDRRCSGHLAERDLQGVPLARFTLRLDRGL